MAIRGEPPLRFQNAYRIAAPRADASVIPWQSENLAIGALTGVFSVAGDTVMALFQARDGIFVGSARMRQPAADRYQAASYGLRLEAYLKSEAERVAKAQGMTLSQSINVAVAAKLSALRTADYVKERAARADIDRRSGWLGEPATSHRATEMRL